MVGRGLLQKHFSKTFVKVSAITEINANFHFSHYKYMETLSCHCNESTWATTIKNRAYVEANFMNMYAKFQLQPPYDFCVQKKMCMYFVSKQCMHLKNLYLLFF